MTRRSAAVVILLAVLATSCAREQRAPAAGGDAATTDAAVDQEIRAVLERYVQAVNAGDEEALRAIWADVEDVSFVNPLQRLRSWNELQAFWQGFLRDGFTRRALTPRNVAIRASGDVAWAVFDWEFEATQADGVLYRARGWETQVYRRTDRGWRISHVHYSVPAEPPAPAQ